MTADSVRTLSACWCSSY